ncbi:MAG: Cna B-type domain-containing protein [Butyrivibrio sp.]|nr:Cna B-type domain-containing protein [Butyrivibrio sp.]
MKKVKIFFSRIVVAVLVFMTVFGFRSMDADARSTIDLSRKGSLSVTYKYGDIFFDGVQSHIYKIGSVTEEGRFSLYPEFEVRSPIKDLNTISNPATAQNQWDKVRDAISPYVVAGSPTESAVSTKGLAVYNNLELGLYLVYTDNLDRDDCTYVFQSFIVSIPQLNDEDEWIYDGVKYIAEATSKCEKYTNDIELEIHKRWKDEGYENIRPTSISVTIRRNGAEFKTVTLNSGNGWSYTWRDVPGCVWEFEEKVDGDYTGTIDKTIARDGTMVIYTLTNGYNPPNTPPPPPPPPNNPPGGPPGGPPDTPPSFPDVLGAVRNLPAVLGARRLPQTGQLWWPLPILLIVGIFFIIKGIRKNHKNA